MKQNITLHDKNWFATGGPARYFCEPQTPHDFVQALAFAQENKLDQFILGEGANVLISDDGFSGLVIKPALRDIALLPHDDTLVRAGAGVSFAHLIDWCLDHTLIGLEEFAGIPGTVGGSVFINIHYFEHLLSHFLVEAQVINRTNGEIMTVDNSWFNFGYNQSTLIDRTYYLISATFQLKKGTDLEAAYAKGRRDEIIRHRVRRYPNAGTCGSFFRNFFDHEVTLEVSGRKMIYVAYYLDKIGTKGTLRCGNAQVSYQHANMLVNTGGATTADIILLARTMQERVLDTFGIIPQPECLLIGFGSFPLLR